MHHLIHFIRISASLVPLCRAHDAFALTTSPSRLTCPACRDLLEAATEPARGRRRDRNREGGRGGDE